jgi:hypothetical protein
MDNTNDAYSLEDAAKTDESNTRFFKKCIAQNTNYKHH